MDALLKLREIERPIIQRRRQAESVVNQALFSRLVARVHRPHLRNRHVRLINNHQKVLWKIIHQRIRRRSRFSAGQHARIVLNAAAKADFFHHFHVIARALLDALGFDKFFVFLEPCHALFHLFTNFLYRRLHFVFRRDIMRCRINRRVLYLTHAFASQRIDFADSLNFVPEKFHAIRKRVGIYRPDFHSISAHAEAIAFKRDVIALVLNFCQPLHERLIRHFHTGAQRNDHFFIINRVAQRVNARDRCDNNHIVSLCQCGCCRMPQPLDFFIDRRIFFDIGIRRCDVCLRLIIVVVRDKKFDGVVRKELAQLRTQLRRQCLIVCQYQRRLLYLLNDIRHGKRLAGTGDTEQRLFFKSQLNALRQLLNGFRLVSRRFVFRY